MTSSRTKEMAFDGRRRWLRGPRCARCERCDSNTRLFCGKCVSSRQFFGQNQFQCFSDEMETFEQIERENAGLKTKIAEKSASKRKTKLMVDLWACCKRIELFQQTYEQTEKHLEQERCECKIVRKRNKTLASNLHKLKFSVKESPKYISKLQTELDRKSKELTLVIENLCALRKRNVASLTSQIFPLIRLTPLCNLEEGRDQSEMIASQIAEALDEKRQEKEHQREEPTSAWWSHIEYSICGQTLQSGDKIARDEEMFLSRSQMAASIEEDAEPCKSTLDKVATALGYVAQLTPILSSLLNVHLPFQLHHSQFNPNNLTQISFQVLYAQLQANVLVLCFHMRIPKHKLVTQHLLHNLALCNEAPTPSFSSYGGYVVHPELIPDIPADWEPVEFEAQPLSDAVTLPEWEWESVTEADVPDMKEVIVSHGGAGAASVIASTFSQVSNMVWGRQISAVMRKK